MSTRSNIGIINKDSSMDVIYCHWDGYPCHNGALLLHHYKEEDKVRRLMQLGDISSLAEKLEPDPGQEHTFEKPADGVVVAYGRERGDKDAHARHYESVDAYRKELQSSNTWIEFVYLYSVAGRQWLWFPVREENGTLVKARPLQESDTESTQAA